MGTATGGFRGIIKMSTYTRKHIMWRALGVIHTSRIAENSHTVEVNSSTLKPDLLTPGEPVAVFSVEFSRPASSQPWNIVSILPEPPADLLPFNITYHYPGKRGAYGHACWAADKKAARKTFLANHPDAKIYRVEDWYDFD
jgi:hypothetical protein